MDRPTLLTVAVIGIAGWLGAALTARSGSVSSRSAHGWGRASFVAALLVPAAMIAAAWFGRLPASSLWSTGLGLGAIGSLAAEYVSLARRRRRWSLVSSAAAVAASPFAAAAAVAGTLLWAQAPVVEALVTIPVSWVAVSLVLAWGDLGSGGAQPAGIESESVIDPPAILGPGFAVTLSAVAALGLYRGAESEGPHWSAAALALAAAVPVALLFGTAVSALLRRGAPRGAIVWQALLSAGFLAGVSAILGPRMFGSAPVLGLVGMGLALGVGLWWVVADTGRMVPDQISTANQGARFGMSVAVLLVLGAFMAAFTLFAGYGVGIMVLSAWLFFAVAAASVGAPARMRAASEPSATGRAAVLARLGALSALAVALLLFRVITTRFEDDLRGVVLTDHFALLGFLAGAALPALLTGLLERTAPAQEPWGLIGLVVSLVVAASVPGVMFAVWGAKVALALVAGLALSVAAYHLAGNTAASAAGPDAGRRAAPVATEWLAPLYALLIAAALTAWLHPVAQIAGQSRADRVRLLSVALAVLIAAVIVWDIAGRVAARRRGLPRTAPSPQGGAG